MIVRYISALIMTVALCVLALPASAMDHSQHSQDNYGPYGEYIPELSVSDQAFIDEQTELYREFLKRTRLGDLAGAEEALSCVEFWEYNQAGHYLLSWKYIELNELHRGELPIPKLADDQRFQLAVYNLIVNGYAPNGMISEAALKTRLLANHIMQKGGERAVPKEKKILAEIAVSVADNKFGWPENVVRENLIKVLKHIDGPYYTLMAIESAILRLPSEQEIKDFLLDPRVGFTVVSEKAATESAPATSTYHNGHAVIVVEYGVEYGESSPKAFHVWHELDSEGAAAFKADLLDDDQYKKWLAEEAAGQEKAKAAAEEEKSRERAYQEFLDNSDGSEK